MSDIERIDYERMSDAEINERCDDCHRRKGQVVIDEVMPPNPHVGIVEPWRFVYRRCRWCKGVETKRRKKHAAALMALEAEDDG